MDIEKTWRREEESTGWNKEEKKEAKSLNDLWK